MSLGQRNNASVLNNTVFKYDCVLYNFVLEIKWRTMKKLEIEVRTKNTKCYLELLILYYLF